MPAKLGAMAARLRTAATIARESKAVADAAPWQYAYVQRARRDEQALLTAKAALERTMEDVEFDEWAAFWMAAGKRKLSLIERLKNIGTLIQQGKASIRSAMGWFFR